MAEGIAVLREKAAERVDGAKGAGRTGAAKEKPFFAPPQEKLFFNDADLDEPVDFVCIEGKSLKETTVNGVKCFEGEVGFVEPKNYWSLLNPFVKAKDSEGNSYFVRGLVGLCIIIEAAKRKEKLKVVCLKKGKNYEIVKW